MGVSASISASRQLVVADERFFQLADERFFHHGAMQHFLVAGLAGVTRSDADSSPPQL
jgi:hypothetical protein